MTSLATGVGSLVHGMTERMGERVPEGLATFPELLRQAGYLTAAFSANPHTPPDTPGKQPYSETYHVYQDAEALNAAVLEFLARNHDRKSFLYVHTMEAHGQAIPGTEEYGYYAPEPYASRLADPSLPPPVAMYDAGICHADANLQHVVDALGQQQVERQTLLMITADHGEYFDWVDGIAEHGGRPRMELTHVPLVVCQPGTVPTGRVVGNNMQHIDLSTTILDMARIPVPAQFSGRSLRDLLSGGDPAELQDRTLFLSGRYLRLDRSYLEFVDNLLDLRFLNEYPRFLRWLDAWFHPRSVAAVAGDLSLMYDVSPRAGYLYNKVLDSDGKQDISNEDADTFASLCAQVRAEVGRQQALAAQLTRKDASVFSSDLETLEALHSLGYLGK